MKRERWTWMPHAAHLCVGRDCQFHLATHVGKFIVSTVGEYMPDSRVREIIANSRGVTLKGQGDERDADWLRKCGYEEVGAGRKYETFVFPAMKAKDKCCPFVASDWSELDSQGYNDPGEAYEGHRRMCQKWARK